MALSLGEKAPLFEALMDGDEVFSMSTPRTSPIVLYFYPTDDTETCTKQACLFRDNMQLFDAHSMKVYGVSPDTVKSHDSFRRKYDLPFRLISDPELKICNAYDVWHEKTLYGRTYMGVVRTTYVIDPKGIITAAWANVRLKGHVEAILASNI